MEESGKIVVTSFQPPRMRARSADLGLFYKNLIFIRLEINMVPGEDCLKVGFGS